MQIKNKTGRFMLSCTHVSKSFEGVDVLRDVSFSISKGEKFGLVGQNGSGKSTLLQILAKVIESDSGNILWAKNLKVAYFPQVHSEEVGLSGGERAKKVLVPLIVSSADIFLLDEPTNNLDIEGLKMVEDFISKSNKAFIIVSHDRKFLNDTIHKIIEIDSTSKSLNVYEGDYSSFITQKEEKVERQWKEYADKVEKTEKFSISLDQRLDWMKVIEKKRKNIKNLPIHDRNKPEAAVLRDKEAKAGRRARIMKDRLERYKEESEDIKKPTHLLPIKIVFENNRGGDRVFELKAIRKKIGKIVIGPLSINISYGNRVHIQGNNGSGKTTLIKMLLGEIMVDGGEIRRGENIQIAYLSQDRWIPKKDISVIDDFLEKTDLPQGEARKILNRYRITTEDVKKNIMSLSPGEYSRLMIAELVAKRPSCIILDEPTNHLDLEVLQELEKGLSQYKGTIIMASHDRYFVDRIKPDVIIDMTHHSRKF